MALLTTGFSKMLGANWELARSHLPSFRTNVDVQMVLTSKLIPSVRAYRCVYVPQATAIPRRAAPALLRVGPAGGAAR